MRRLPTLAALLLLAAPAAAAPLPAEVPPAPPLRHATESLQFAQQLVVLCDQVSALYVRPVPRLDLLTAALTGLYEAAGRPTPDNLAARLARADRELVFEVARIREDVGAAPGLRGRDPLVPCCQALPRLLDPYSAVVSAEEQIRLPGLEEEGEGVGVELQEPAARGAVVLERVMPGGAAQRAGLRPGDRVLAVNDRAVGDWPAGQVADLLTSGPAVRFGPSLEPNPTPEIRSLRLACRRGDRDFEVAVERNRFPMEYVQGVRRRDDQGWEYVADRERGLAVVRLAALGRGTTVELRRVLGELRQREVRGLVLDLRWCPGGYLDEATDSARLLSPEGVLTTISYRGEQPTVFRATGEGAERTLPLVVLVNAETSGGPELVAAALQDQRRAVVVGQRTRGKASVQRPIPIGAGLGLKLTTGTFQRPSGKNLHRFADSKPGDDWGVRPDVECRVSPELAKAIRADWLALTLRPGGAAEAVALDDLDADPQLRRALDVLARRVEEQARPQGRACTGTEAP